MLVQVKLFGKPLGTIDWDAERRQSIFQYNDPFLSGTLEPSPILMPKEGRTYLTNRDHTNFHNLPYLLSDSMPDDFGNIMMKEWLRQQSLSYDSINPVDRLTYVGIRGMGALEYEPLNHKTTENYHVNVQELLEVAQNVLAGKTSTTFQNLDEDSLTSILRIGTSVGGARAKALLAIKEDSGGQIIEIKAGDILQTVENFSYWLLKMDGANEATLGESDGMGKIEYAYYLMAKKCGIHISESRLYKEGSRHHFMTKRFDRSESGEKIHMQTLGSLIGVDFKIPKASSYETLFRTMKRLRLTYDQFEQQFRRMAFNVIARNHDDHVKNFSFLMDHTGKWSISPAYDITYSYKPGGTWTDAHQSSINGKFDGFTREDLIQLGKYFGVKKSKHIIDEIVEGVSKWPGIATEINIPKQTISSIAKNLRLDLK